MPTYTNTSESSVTPPGFGTLSPGDSITPVQYLWPVPAGLELTDHEPAARYPVRLFGDSVPSGVVDGIPEYKSLFVNNATNAAILLIFNGDDANAMVLPAGAIWEYDLAGSVYQIELDGAGAGSAYVWGVY